MKPASETAGLLHTESNAAQAAAWDSGKRRWWLVLRDPSSPESAGAGGVCSPLSPHQIREKNQESKTLASLKPTHPSLGDSSQKLETWDLLHSLRGAQWVGEGPFQVVLAGLGVI